MDRHVRYLGVVVDRAAVADLLTFSRLLSAPFLAWLVASRHVDGAAIVVGLAWCTDFFDGRLARSAVRDTILKEWDLRTDSWMAVALGVGMGLGGYFSWWVLGPVAAVVFVASVTFRNPSLVMVGTGYLFGAFLLAATQHGTLRWLPALYVVVALIAGRRRFFGVVLPAVWNGLTAVLPGHRSRGTTLVVDDWLD